MLACHGPPVWRRHSQGLNAGLLGMAQHCVAYDRRRFRLRCHPDMRLAFQHGPAHAPQNRYPLLYVHGIPKIR
jgi:hypothetical protein